MMVLRVSIKHFLLAARLSALLPVVEKTCHTRVQTCINSADGFGGGPVGLGVIQRHVTHACMLLNMTLKGFERLGLLLVSYGSFCEGCFMLCVGLHEASALCCSHGVVSVEFLY